MINLIYGLFILALPFFTGWAIYKINYLSGQVAMMSDYHETDHKVFMMEIDTIHRRLNQIEVITFTVKKKD